MHWFVTVCLLCWLVWLSRRVIELRTRLERAERLLKQAPAEREPTAVPAAVARREDVAPRHEDPSAVPEAAPRPAVIAEPERSGVRPPPTPAGPSTRAVAGAWLAENGLAWIGGALLGLGGLFLVTYAAQRGVFTPQLRIGSAVGLGMILLAVSEWLRRQADRGEPRGHRLAAAAAAGAGAATLYAAAWAAYWLYGFMGLGMAGGALGLISLGLLVLAGRHGEPLAILAIAGAMLAPVITGPERWAAPALTAYLSLLVLTGFAATGVRRWGWAGMTTLAGAVLWAMAGFAAEGYVRVVALALAPLVLAVIVREWQARRGISATPSAAMDAFAALPMAALIAASLLFVALGGPALAGLDLNARGGGAVVLVGVAAYVAVRRLVASPIQLVAFIAVAGGVVLAGATVRSPPPAAEIWNVVAVLTLATAGAWSTLAAAASRERVLASLAAFTALVAGLVLHGPLAAQFPWLSPAITALALGSCATLIGRRSVAASEDLALAIWIWCATAATLATLQALSPSNMLPVVFGLASSGLAILHARTGWRGFAASAIAAALAAFAALLNPLLVRALLTHEVAAGVCALTSALSAGVVFGGAVSIRRSGRVDEVADALSTGALFIALAGAFLLLRLWGSGPVGARLDPFAESTLRTLLILSAGVLAAMVRRPQAGLIGRWRADALLCAGLGHAVLFQVLMFNPLWATWRPAVAGPPIFDTLAIGYLAPALLLAFAAVRHAERRPLLRLFAGAALGLTVVWAALETRRLFQGSSLHGGTDALGRAEAAAYAVLLLAVGRGLFEAFRRAASERLILSHLVQQIRALAFAGGGIALVFATLVFLWGASPWWGPLDRPLTSQAEMILLFGLYALGLAGTLSLIGPAEAEGQPTLARSARILAVAIAFALLSLLIRWGFHGLDMRPDLREASLQTWTFSAAWGLYGFALLVFAVIRRESELRWAGLVVLLGTTAKIFLFDMARLEGVVRAGSFLAVGALLLAAAVIARRLSNDRTAPAAAVADGAA